MKLYARCEKCGKLGDVTHVSGGGYGQAMNAYQSCSYTISLGWQTIASKTFCGDCSGLIQAALDAAMRPTS